MIRDAIGLTLFMGVLLYMIPMVYLIFTGNMMEF